MITLKRLARLLTENFGPPYLPPDAVSVYSVIRKGEVAELSIRIGARDIQIDGKGRLLGSGTLLLHNLPAINPPRKKGKTK